MKKKFIIALVSAATLSFAGCANDTGKNAEGIHIHEDGSSHADHDTTKPAQQEFVVTDSTVIPDTPAHTHENGEPHSH